MQLQIFLVKLESTRNNNSFYGLYSPSNLHNLCPIDYKNVIEYVELYVVSIMEFLILDFDGHSHTHVTPLSMRPKKK